MDDRSDQQAGVALVDAGAGVAEAAGDVAGEAGSEAEHPLLPPEPGRVPASSAAIAASQSIAAREVAAFGPGLVGDDQPGAGFERVEAVSAGTERAPAVVLADPAMRAAELHPVKVVAAMMRGAG